MDDFQQAEWSARHGKAELVGSVPSLTYENQQGYCSKIVEPLAYPGVAASCWKNTNVQQVDESKSNKCCARAFNANDIKNTLKAVLKYGL